MEKHGVKLAISITAVLIIVAIIFSFFLYSDDKQETSITEYLNLGDKYLLDMNYEQALVQFLKVIEIEPMNERAYLGAAEAYMGLGRIDDAIAMLERGLAALPDSVAIKSMLDELLYERERKNLATEATPILTELAALCQKEDYDAAFVKMQSDEYAKVAALAGYLNRPYIADTEYGRIGVYEVNSETYGDYMVYYGGYAGDMREGRGAWLGYYDGNNYYADCEWVADAPNGDAVVREWSSRLDEEVVYRIISGKTVGGLWNGDVMWSFDRNDGTVQNFPVRFDMGHWVVIRVKDDGDDVVSETGNTESGIMSVDTEDTDLTEGIVGYSEHDS